MIQWVPILYVFNWPFSLFLNIHSFIYRLQGRLSFYLFMRFWLCLVVFHLLLIMFFFYYRPPVGGRFYDMKVVSGYVFLRTYYRYVYKKITANHAAARSYKHWCEAVLEKLDCLRKGGDSRVSGCTRLHCRVGLRPFFDACVNVFLVLPLI